MLSKFKVNRDIKCAPVYFNWITKTVTKPKYGFDKSFQQVFNKIDNWLSEGSGWRTESVDPDHVNISVYSSLSGTSYIELPDNSRNSKQAWLMLKAMTINDFFCVILDIKITSQDNNKSRSKNG